MFNIFSNKNKIQKLIEQDGIDYATERFAAIISEMIGERHIAYQFILEEIEAASKGNEDAKEFARNSGIPKSEFFGAMSQSCDEIDGPGGPQQFLLAISSQLNSDVDLMVKFRTMITEKIMRHFKIGKYSRQELSSSSESSLVFVVDKVENSDHGAFVNINNDLGYFIKENEDCSPILKMAYAYARRFAVAGMYIQGIVEKEAYDYVLMIFKGMQFSTGHSVEFQELAANQAFELIESYTDLFDRESLKFMVYLVENGLDASAIGNKVHNIHEIAFIVRAMKEQFVNKTSVN